MSRAGRSFRRLSDDFDEFRPARWSNQRSGKETEMSTTQATAAIAMLRSASTRIVSPAGQTSGEQLARPGALALAERLGIAVTICGAATAGGIGPQEFADRPHEAIRGA
jgi:hypothetical protein